MVLVYIAMTVLLLVLGFTQVYAKVHAFGWTGFGTFLLIAPIISLGYIWFKLKIYRLPTPKERLDQENTQPACADLNTGCSSVQASRARIQVQISSR
jgi:Na+/proline symporter